MTMAPFDLDGVDPQQMSDRERKLLNAYHKKGLRYNITIFGKGRKGMAETATREI